MALLLEEALRLTRFMYTLSETYMLSWARPVVTLHEPRSEEAYLLKSRFFARWARNDYRLALVLR